MALCCVGSTAGNGYGGGMFLHYYATLRDNLFHHNAGSRGERVDGRRRRAIQGYSLVVFTMTNNLLRERVL